MTHDMILTPASSRWSEFVAALYREIVTYNDGATLEWRCTGDQDDLNRHRGTRAVLARMGGIDIEATLAGFDAYGGGCDCRVLSEVDAQLFTEIYLERH
jgi:hypothetical protein